MTEFIITPKVNETQEFIEIANDFANPLDLVREAISNAFDAQAKELYLSFETEQQLGESVFVIRINDDGAGMSQSELQAFFDLGNSTRRGDKTTIGEKGHGTKVYFNARKIIVDTQRDGVRLVATLDAPFAKLHERVIPCACVREMKSEDTASGTKITIYGYNNNRRERFTHERLRDHILWFSKFGSIEQQFEISRFSGVTLHLKGLDRDNFEQLQFGHVFPSQSPDANTLFNHYNIQAPDFYSRRITRTGALPKHPEVRYHAVFSVEGKRVKYDYNRMLRRPGYSAPDGAYTVQDRYGLWLCKDFIPVQRKNEWITSKGSEFTKLHAFFNCQALKLTANRGSVENTPAEILQDIEDVIRRIYQELLEDEDWLNLAYLEEEAEGYNTVEKERKNFAMRVSKVNRGNIASFRGLNLVEPHRESGVFGILVQLMAIDASLFPFAILDYDTHEGIDVIVKANDFVAVSGSRLYYVELKHTLTSVFNHSFENQHSIVCWDTGLKHGEIVKDINREERKLVIISPGHDKDHTRYFLENPRRAHRIEVFVLKDFLAQKLGLVFRPRTERDVV